MNGVLRLGSPLALLVALFFSSACAAARGPGGGFQDVQTLGGVASLSLEAEPPALAALCRETFRNQGGPAIVSPAKNLPRLSLRAVCGRDAQVKGEVPSHVECMGWTEDSLSPRLTPPEGFHPSCQVLLTVRVGPKEIYRLVDWAPCETPTDLQNLVKRLLKRFLDDWRTAQPPAPAPAPEALGGG